MAYYPNGKVRAERHRNLFDSLNEIYVTYYDNGKVAEKDYWHNRHAVWAPGNTIEWNKNGKKVKQTWVKYKDTVSVFNATDTTYLFKGLYKFTEKLWCDNGKLQYASYVKNGQLISLFFNSTGDDNTFFFFMYACFAQLRIAWEQVAASPRRPDRPAGILGRMHNACACASASMASSDAHGPFLVQHRLVIAVGERRPVGELVGERLASPSSASGRAEPVEEAPRERLLRRSSTGRCTAAPPRGPGRRSAAGCCTRPCRSRQVRRG